MTADRVTLGLTPIAIGRGPSRSAVVGELQDFLGDRPRDAETWFELGCALNGEGRYEEAAAALHSALTLSPSNLGVQCAYAFALCGVGEVAEASSLLEEVIQRDPGNGWAYEHLAAARFRQGACDDAAQLWECAAGLVEDPGDCLENLAMAYRRLGDLARERRCWERLAAIDPENPAAGHMLGAVGAAPMRARATDGYVRHLFDRFAPDFDRVLEVLEYRVPGIVEAWMCEKFGEPGGGGGLRVLDAGCGTGLCGERLRGWARELVGVDLSAGMLARARDRGVYDELFESELVAFLRDHERAFDVIVAGDVLCYFGDLEPFCESALGALRAGGRLGFSAERGEGESGFVICSHGRYAHTEAHVREALQGCRDVEVAEIVARLESGEAVGGYWVSA